MAYNGNQVYAETQCNQAVRLKCITSIYLGGNGSSLNVTEVSDG